MVIITHFLAILPLSFARKLGRAGARLAESRSPRTLEITRINLNLCFPDLPSEEIESLALQSHYSLGELTAESGASWIWPTNRLLGQVNRITGREILDQAYADGKGVIAILPHLGNWEVVGLYLAEHFPTTSLYDPPAYPPVDRMIYRSRSRNGANLVPTNRRGVAQLVKALQAGNVTAILPDQVPRDPGSSVHAPFFGRDAVTMTLVSRLLQRSNSRAILITAIRNTEGFEIHIHQVNEEIYHTDPVLSTSAMNSGLEGLIQLAPEQYAWEYKRFRPVPRDGSSPYRAPREH